MLLKLNKNVPRNTYMSPFRQSHKYGQTDGEDLVAICRSAYKYR